MLYILYSLNGHISLGVPIADREENRNRQSILFFLLKVYLEDLLHFCNCSWCHITKLGYFDDAQTCFEFFDYLLVFLLQLLCSFDAAFLSTNLASLCSIVLVAGFEAFLDGCSFVFSKLAEHSKEHREKSILAAIIIEHVEVLSLEVNVQVVVMEELCQLGHFPDITPQPGDF